MVDARVLTDQVWARLQTLNGATDLEGVNTYRGGLYGPDGREVTPPHDPDGRVHPYAVLYASPGRRFSLRQSAHPDNLDWGFQITCVGGDDNRALWCFDEVRGLFTGHWLNVGDGTRALITEVTDPGPIRVDRGVTPHRSYFPVLFGLATH